MIIYFIAYVHQESLIDRVHLILLFSGLNLNRLSETMFWRHHTRFIYEHLRQRTTCLAISQYHCNLSCLAMLIPSDKSHIILAQHPLHTQLHKADEIYD